MIYFVTELLRWILSDVLCAFKLHDVSKPGSVSSSKVKGSRILVSWLRYTELRASTTRWFRWTAGHELTPGQPELSTFHMQPTPINLLFHSHLDIFSWYVLQKIQLNNGHR
jgi:hypothetical protein